MFQNSSKAPCMPFKPTNESSTVQRILHMGQRSKSACTHIVVRIAEFWHRAAGGLLLIPLPLIDSSSIVVDRPEGSAEEFDKVLLRT